MALSQLFDKNKNRIFCHWFHYSGDRRAMQGCSGGVANYILSAKPVAEIIPYKVYSSLYVSLVVVNNSQLFNK